MKTEVKVICPRCGHDNIVKHGFAAGNQRYKCKDCSYAFSVMKKGKGLDNSLIRLAIILYLQGVPYRKIAQIIGVSHVTIMQWIRKIGHQINLADLQVQQQSSSQINNLHIQQNGSWMTYSNGKLFRDEETNTLIFILGQI